MQPTNYHPACSLLADALPPAETDALIAAAEAAGFGATGASYPARYRNNDRLVRDDPATAAALFARLRSQLPAEITDGNGDRWQLIGLNPRFRYCRYRGGQSFTIHRDGAHHRGPEVRSHRTLQVYLNDDFTGGATRFYADRLAGSPPAWSVAPRRGAAIVFDHALWHDGAPVTAGTKYVMRTDLLYQRIGTGVRRETTGHLGYIWDLIALRDGLLASGGRDGTIRLWDCAGPEPRCASIIRSHHGSVSALAQAADNTLWTGGRDGVIRIFAPGGAPAASFSAHHGAVLALQATPDGIASAGADGRINIWSAAGLCRQQLTGHRGWVWDLAWTDGVLLSAAEDGEVRAWPGGLRMSGAIGAQAIAAAAGDFTVGLIDGTIASADGQRFRGHDGAIRSLARLPGGLLASGGEDDAVRVWRGDQLIGEQRRDDFVTALVPLADGRLASASYDGRVVLHPAQASAKSYWPTSRPSRSLIDMINDRSMNASLSLYGSSGK